MYALEYHKGWNFRDISISVVFVDIPKAINVPTVQRTRQLTSGVSAVWNMAVL